MANNWWSGRPWRMIQTNLRQIDMRDISAKRVMEDLQWFGANVLMINTSGIIASYPTVHPFHSQSEYLTGDSLVQIIEACHGAGIRVIGRMDFSKVRRPLYEQHPEWAYVGTDGNIVDYNGDVHVCFNSRYQQQHAFEIMEETVKILPLDGVFFNFGGYTSSYDYSGNLHGDCQCENCKRRFREMFGTELPPQAGEKIPELYEQFKAVTSDEYRERVFSTLKRLNPDLCVANFPDQNDGFVRKEAGTYLRSGRFNWCYESSELNKSSDAGPDMLTSITTVDFLDISYRLAAVSPHQQQLRLAQSLAHGNCLDYYLIGRLDDHEDKSGFEGVRQLYQYHRAHEEHYAGLRPVADILLVKPEGHLFTEHSAQNEYYGWYKTLAENHYLFDCLPRAGLPAKDFSPYKLVILPALEVDEGTAARLEEYVEQGGRVLAIGQAPAQTGAMRRLLGIDAIHCERKDMRSAYFRFRQGEDRGRLAESGLVYLQGRYVYAQYAEGVQGNMQMIPPCKFGPPERCYYEQVTDYPAWTAAAVQRGRGIFLPWYPGTQYWQNGHLSMLQLIVEVLEYGAELVPLGGNLPPAVEVTLNRRVDGSLLLHLVNASGFWGGTYHAPLPLGGLCIRLPLSKPPVAVRALADGEEMAFEWKEGCLAMQVGALGLLGAYDIRFA